MKFGIDRMRLLVAALGHPERRYPVIHVAGTNGKGSVSAMLDAILHAAGWRTGLYTSPHLVKLGERVQVDRQLLGEEEIVAYVNELRPVAERPGAGRTPTIDPSFFRVHDGHGLPAVRAPAGRRGHHGGGARAAGSTRPTSCSPRWR